MDRISGKLTVFFENPFWVGIFEIICHNKLSVCKVTFGAEPRNGEVYEFILKNYRSLKFSPAVTAAVKEIRLNPKRMQREAHKELYRKGIGTKSQNALKLQHEQSKTERKALSREMRDAEKQRRFDLKQQKKKEKHRGR